MDDGSREFTSSVGATLVYSGELVARILPTLPFSSIRPAFGCDSLLLSDALRTRRDSQSRRSLIAFLRAGAALSRLHSQCPPSG